MRCAKCGTERHDLDMARVWVNSKGEYFPLCHPVGRTEPSCFDKYERGHALYGEPVTVLKDRVKP